MATVYRMINLLEENRCPEKGKALIASAMNRDRYLSAVYNWMIRQISGWIMKNFARLLKKEWNPADIFSQGEYDAYPLKIATNGLPARK